MSTRRAAKAFGRWWGRSLVKATRQATRQAASRARAASTGEWLQGVAMAGHGARRYRLYRPAGIAAGERVPLLVMLHGCGQDAAGFAASTRMNRLADHGRFLVLYPEQERLANAQRCWNWFDTDSGRAYAEAALIVKAVDQVCGLYPVDRGRCAIAGFSAGASMAALVATRYPAHFCAVAMHSGVAPGAAHSASSALRAMRGQTRRQVDISESKSAAWPPLLVVQGGLDRVVAAGNGAVAAQLWATAAVAVAAAPRSVQRGQRHPSRVTDFKAGTEVVATLVEVPALAHAWSGGASGQPHSDPRGADASRMIWAFVAKRLRSTGL